MCGGGRRAAEAADAARESAANDAKKMRQQMEADREAMQREMALNREEVGRTAPAPAPYRLKSQSNPVTVKRKKANRTANVGADSLRISMNTGGGATGGGVNIG